MKVNTCQVLRGGPTTAVGQHPEVWVGTAALLPAGSLTDRRLGELMQVLLPTPTLSGQPSGPLQASGVGVGRGVKRARKMDLPPAEESLLLREASKLGLP